MGIKTLEEAQKFLDSGYGYEHIDAPESVEIDILRKLYGNKKFKYFGTKADKYDKHERVASTTRALNEIRSSRDLKSWGTMTFSGFKFENKKELWVSQLEVAKGVIHDMASKCPQGSVIYTIWCTHDGMKFTPAAAGCNYCMLKTKYEWVKKNVVTAIEKGIDETV